MGLKEKLAAALNLAWTKKFKSKAKKIPAASPRTRPEGISPRLAITKPKLGLTDLKKRQSMISRPYSTSVSAGTSPPKKLPTPTPIQKLKMQSNAK